MRILYLCADPGIRYWGTKGASIHLREFTSALAGTGAEVTVAVARRGRSPNGTAPPLPLIELPRNKSGFLHPVTGDGDRVALSSEARQFAEHPAVCGALQDLHRRRPFDLICERYSLFGLGGQEAARHLGIPHVLEINAPLVEEAERHRRLVLAPLARAIEGHLFSSSDHIVTVSKPLAEYVRTIAPEADVTPIPNGVNLERFQCKGPADNDAISSGSTDGVVIGFVGSLKPWHGVELLLDAFARVRQEQTGSRLMIVGDGPARATLEEQARSLHLGDAVQFRGAVPHERMPETLKEIDIAVAPYPRLEHFYFSPLKVYEYMAAGRAIVASRIGQMIDILDDGTTALLPPPGDVAALATALAELQRDPELRRRLGLRAQASALSRHGWQHRMDDWYTAFHKAAARKEARKVRT
jgi:glycosyltransferase involved in cell wall biosynthesis